MKFQFDNSTLQFDITIRHYNLTIQFDNTTLQPQLFFALERLIDAPHLIPEIVI